MLGHATAISGYVRSKLVLMVPSVPYVPSSTKHTSSREKGGSGAARSRPPLDLLGTQEIDLGAIPTSLDH